MKTVIEQTTDLIGRAKAETLARRRDAGERLRAILLRNESPEQGDEAALLELMGELGIQPDDLPGVLELVRTFGRYEKLLAEEGTYRSQADSANASIQAIDRETQAEHERIDREAKARKAPIEAERLHAQAMLGQVNEARRWNGETRAKWVVLTDQVSIEDARKAVYGERGVPHGSDRVVRSR